MFRLFSGVFKKMIQAPLDIPRLKPSLIFRDVASQISPPKSTKTTQQDDWEHDKTQGGDGGEGSDKSENRAGSPWKYLKRADRL